MPTPTPDEIAAAAAQNAADGIASAEGDQGKSVALDPLKQLQVADAVAARNALSGRNRKGGGKGGWGRIVKVQRAELPGGGP